MAITSLEVILSHSLIRLIFLIGYSASPDWELLAGDPLYNDRMALEIAGGDLIGDEVFLQAHMGKMWNIVLFPVARSVLANTS